MPDVRQPTYTDAQLHERACIVCGRADGELLPDGHVQVEGIGGYAVAACPDCQGVRS